MAANIPQQVRETLEKLRERHKHSVIINTIKGKYYAYEATTRSISGVGNKTFNLYLGRIKDNGEFIEAHHRKRETRVDSLDESIKAKSAEDPLHQIMHPDAKDIAILEEISNNGRVPIASIAKEIGMSAPSVEYRLKKLEKRYGIKYVIDIAPRPFGFFRFIVLVKFMGKAPDLTKLKKLLEDEPTVQFAAALKGSHDIFVYMFAEDTHKLENKLYAMRSSDVLSRSKAGWDVSYITYAYGYVPMRGEFIESLKEIVWRRTKETPRKKPGMITYREYLMLKELNLNGREEFADMDRKFGLDPGASQYTYNSLVDKGIIKRITICMQNVPIRFDALMICPQTDIGSFNLHRKEFLQYMIESTNTPTNRFTLVGDIGSPYGLLFIAPIYDFGVDALTREIGEKTYSAEIEPSSIITDVLVGTLGHRKIPPESTVQYNIIKELETK